MDNFRENLRHWNGLSDSEVSTIQQNHIDELMDISEFSDYVFDQIWENCGDCEIIDIIGDMNLISWSLLVLDWKNTQGEAEIRQLLETL